MSEHRVVVMAGLASLAGNLSDTRLDSPSQTHRRYCRHIGRLLLSAVLVLAGQVFEK